MEPTSSSAVRRRGRGDGIVLHKQVKNNSSKKPSSRKYSEEGSTSFLRRVWILASAISLLCVTIQVPTAQGGIEGRNGRVVGKIREQVIWGVPASLPPASPTNYPTPPSSQPKRRSLTEKDIVTAQPSSHFPQNSSFLVVRDSYRVTGDSNVGYENGFEIIPAESKNSPVAVIDTPRDLETAAGHHGYGGYGHHHHGNKYGSDETGRLAPFGCILEIVIKYVFDLLQGIMETKGTTVKEFRN